MRPLRWPGTRTYVAASTAGTTITSAAAHVDVVQAKKLRNNTGYSLTIHTLPRCTAPGFIYGYAYMRNYPNIKDHGQTNIVVDDSSIRCTIGFRRITIAVVDDVTVVAVAEELGREAVHGANNNENNSQTRGARIFRRSSDSENVSGVSVHVLRRPTEDGYTSIRTQVTGISPGPACTALRKLWNDRRFQFRRDTAPMTEAQANAARPPLSKAIFAHPIISQFFKVLINGGGLVPVDFNEPIDFFGGVCTLGLPGLNASKNACMEEFAISGAQLSGHARAWGRSISMHGSLIRDRASIGGDAFLDTGCVLTTRVVLGGSMSVLRDASGSPILRGEYRLSGDFNLIGTGHLSLGGDALIDKASQVNAHVRAVMGHTK